MEASIVSQPALAADGQRRIDWVRRNMPILATLEARFADEQPFAGLRALVCVHLEAKTANLALVLRAGGAEVAVTGSNPGSTRDEIVAALAAAGLHVYARHGASPDEMRRHMRLALAIRPDIVIDDGGDIVELLHEDAAAAANVRGACEETTTGVLRARARARAGSLGFPVLAINDARCKYLFDNVHGTGQSVWDAIMRSGNTTVAGKTAVIVGFGWCGRGIALRARGLGARVVVCEVDPVKAADAAMNGYDVMPLRAACAIADIIVTATGVRHTLDSAHFEAMKSGVMLANAGHFWTEIHADALKGMALEAAPMREQITGYRLDGDRWVYLLGDAHIVNIACGDGHPAEIMDTSFALQALSARYLAQQRTRLPADVHEVPAAIDEEVAQLKLAAMNLSIDTLTAAQQRYLAAHAVDD